MNTTERGNEHPSPHAAEPAAENSRDARGRFGPGNPGGPGNPYARRVAELRQVMLECVTKQEMEIIVGELMVQAKGGNLAAIKLLFQYIIGKPPAAVDPDTLDVQEVEQYRRAPEHATITEIVGARMPADLACDLLRGVTAHAGRVEANYIAEGLLNPESEPDEDYEDEVEPPPDCQPRATNGKGDGEPARPATGSAPSPNRNSDADATRRRTTPPPAGSMNRPAANHDGRNSPRAPAGA
jgi:hypothetical protein